MGAESSAKDMNVDVGFVEQLVGLKPTENKAGLVEKTEDE